MKPVIRDGRIVADEWRVLPSEAELPGDSTGLLLPLGLWRAHRDATDPARTGVWLAPGDAPDALLPELQTLPVIAIHFPVFTDGRGYSLARLLRHRHGYTGELRAFGDVLRDQVYFLRACGFNAFCLRDDQSAEDALAAFGDYAWAPLAGRGRGGHA